MSNKKKRQLFVLIFLIIASIVAIARGQEVYYNAKVYTADKNNKYATAFVVKDGKFIYVGNDDEALKLGNGIDLKGMRIIPGMIDAHCYPVFKASINGVDIIQLRDDMTSKEVIDTLATLASQIEYTNRPYIIAQGIGKSCNPQLASELDIVSRNYPIIILSKDGNSCWLNSKSMEMAGISKFTPDPIPEESFYERDTLGNPSGKIIEAPAIYSVIKRLGIFDAENLKTTLPDINKAYSSYGYTGVIDAGFLVIDEKEALHVISQLEQDEKLPLRYYTCYQYYGDSIEPYDKALESITTLREEFNTPLIKVDAIKILSDGIVKNCTAYMTDEYIPNDSGYGVMLLSPFEIFPLATNASENEFGVHINAVGDKAIWNSIDLYGQMGKTTGKKVIANAQIMPQEWIKKASKRKDIIFSVSPYKMLEFCQQTLNLLGEKRYSQQYPLKSMIKKGLTITFGSDFAHNENDINPFYNLWVAIASNKAGGPSSMLPSNENITIEDGIDAYTINAASQVDDDINIGSISKGKNADFVILAQDIFEIPFSEIKNVKVDATFLQGKPTYINQENISYYP